MAVQTAFRSVADHVHSAAETCPYCEQPVPNDRAEEIREKFDAVQRRQAAEQKARLESEIAAVRTQAEEAKNAELAQMKLDNEAALQKQKDEAALQKAAAVEEGKALANASLQQIIEKMTADQAEAKSKLEEADQQRLAAIADLTKAKEEQEALIAQRTAEVRSAVDKSKLDEINSIKAQHAEESKTLNDQIAALQKRVAAEEGEGADLKLIDVLKARFPSDEFKSVCKGSGADLIHIIKNNRKICGKILYDTRNRNAWNSSFATNLRSDMVSEKADHAVLTTSKFPSGAQQVHLCEGVVACNPARAAAIAEILRIDIIRAHGQRVSAEDREAKTAKLYDFIVSDEFGKLLGSVAGNDEKLLQLEEDEKRAHGTMWEKRGRLLKNSQQLHAKLRDRVDGIIGTSDTV